MILALRIQDRDDAAFNFDNGVVVECPKERRQPDRLGIGGGDELSRVVESFQDETFLAQVIR